MIVRVDITVADIAAGCRGNMERCPFALAILRLVRSHVEVHVAGNMVKLLDKKAWREYWTGMPEHDMEWIRRFDTTGTAEPFTGWVEIPDDLVSEDLLLNRMLNEIYASAMDVIKLALNPVTISA